MISLILIILAAFCNSIMDNIKDHWYKSRFNKLNPKFWNPEISWKEAKTLNLTTYHVDAWHIFKSIMIACLCFAIVVYKPIFNPILDFLLFGLGWNLSFDLFYNKLLNN